MGRRKRNAVDQDQFSLFSESEAAKRIQHSRNIRNAEHGRKPGWSLRLNPSPGYADMVEGRSQAEVIYSAQRDELEAQFNAGAVSGADFALRLAELGPPPETVCDQDKMEPNLSLTQRVGLSTTRVSYTKEVSSDPPAQVVSVDSHNENDLVN